MNIAVIGLGLIGGSFCKAISKRTEHSCFGIDINTNTISSAIEQGAIKKSITPTELKDMDFVIVSLHPQQTIEFVIENADNFKPNSIIIDTCGVKTEIVQKATELLAKNNVQFLGCHPMAGREFSGFDYSLETLFDNASFIITPSEFASEKLSEDIKQFALSLGFKKVVITTPTEHDRVIAFTSQLAHIVSNAYIKSPSLQKQSGFSAGSFLDLTRVAQLNENMWTSLFMMNKEPLIFEIDTIINNLNQYRQAMMDDDDDKLKQLLKDGRILKENSLT